MKYKSQTWTRVVTTEACLHEVRVPISETKSLILSNEKADIIFVILWHGESSIPTNKGKAPSSTAGIWYQALVCLQVYSVTYDCERSADLVIGTTNDL